MKTVQVDRGFSYPAFVVIVVLILIATIFAVGLYAQQAVDRQRAIDAINALPAVVAPMETCNPDGTPNGVDEDRDGAVDEICRALPVCAFTLSATAANVGAASSLGTVSLTAAPATCAPSTWTASAGAAWLTVTPSAGAGSSALSFTVASNSSTSPRSGTLTIAGQAFTVNQAGAAQPPPGPDLVFRENFNVSITRSQTDAPQRWIERGWSGAKISQTASGARGYIYTAATFEDCGPSPAGGNAGIFEALPNGIQTDFYLQYGNATDALPGDMWMQFWYCHTVASQFSTREKFLYFSKDGAFPSHGHLYMVMLSTLTYNPANPIPFGTPSNNGLLVVRQADGVSDIFNPIGDPDARGNIGQHNPVEWLRPGRWALVKMHFRTTATSGNSWEAWIKPVGGSFVKVAEWIAPSSPPGFRWNIPAGSVGGHRVLRMPTTVDFNKKFGLDDFVIARTEAALPIY